MADLMWSTVKEPLDSALCFDKESLDLAFKYFMSPTLTMRLAGLSQVTVSPSLLAPASLGVPRADPSSILEVMIAFTTDSRLKNNPLQSDLCQKWR